MKRAYFFLIVTVVLFLSGCQRRAYDLPLHQEIDNIVKIELSDHTAEERVVLCALTESDISAFMDGLLSSQCYQYFNDPPVENKYLSVYLYYQNGDVDILGTDICDVISDTASQAGWYYIDAEDMYNLFAGFVDPSKIPEK